jgi:hypothetical protein
VPAPPPRLPRCALSARPILRRARPPRAAGVSVLAVLRRAPPSAAHSAAAAWAERELAGLGAVPGGPARATLLALLQVRAARPLATCPISTEGWTRRVHFVREEGGGVHVSGRGGSRRRRTRSAVSCCSLPPRSRLPSAPPACRPQTFSAQRRPRQVRPPPFPPRTNWTRLISPPY